MAQSISGNFSSTTSDNFGNGIGAALRDGQATITLNRSGSISAATTQSG